MGLRSNGRVRHHGRLTSAIPRPSSVLLHSRPLLSAVTLLAVVLGVAATFAHHWLLEFDRPLSSAIRGDEAAELFRSITRAGSHQLAVPIALVAAIALWKRCRALAMSFPAAVVAAVLTDVVLKVIIDRPRPPSASVGTALSSFPSGHVIQAAIVFGLLPPAIYIVTRRAVAFWATVAIFLIVVPAVGYSRIYLGAHWPSDVLASFFVGATLLLGAEYFVGSEFASAHCPGCALHHPSDERPPRQEEPG